MTIRPGEEWGSEVPRPGDLRVARDDAELAALLTDGSGAPTGVAAGDLFRTIGARPIGDRSVLRQLSLDLVRVTVDGGEPVASVAHVVIRAPTAVGSWWRGPVTAVMNAEFIGTWDVAPRGHPNDGRVEVFEIDASMSIRQRLAVARRMRSASHLPHPLISRRSVRSAAIEHDRPMDVIVDGVRRCRGRHVAIEVEPDAATLHA